MMHTNRVFCVANIDDADELARKLTEHTWTLCTGFRHAGHLYLNDSTCEDAIVEFAIIRESDLRQIESITFGWCDFGKAQAYIQQITAGEFSGDYGTVKPEQIQTAAEHPRCHLCA